MKSVLEIQRALLEAGFDPGPLDGIRGRRTIRAIKKFQVAVNLYPDGIVGPLTIKALFKYGEQESSISLPWYEEAQRLMGTREIVGPGSNKEILDWAEGLGLDYNEDDIPWCGLFVAHCISSQLPDEILPRNVLGARSWTSFGIETSPREGAIMVFWRGKRTGWRGHVGFYAYEDEQAYGILGGNQSNSVNIARISKNRLLGAYWPATAIGLVSKPNYEIKIGSLSTNEE